MRDWRVRVKCRAEEVEWRGELEDGEGRRKVWQRKFRREGRRGTKEM